jgi:hypothetical protein
VITLLFSAFYEYSVGRARRGYATVWYLKPDKVLAVLFSIGDLREGIAGRKQDRWRNLEDFALEGFVLL